ncbi:MAG TPA: PilW family protein [Vicinamibacterales bacterium]|nr:PilW family protein [Vicinamibacterales bacterium]
MRTSIRKQRGLTLVELMIAMTLGMILSLAIGQVFMSSRHTNTSTEANARMQENARFAFLLLERELRMAGFVRTGAANGFTPAIRPIAFADGTGVNSSDEITVRYQGSDNAAATGADNTVVNCIGEPARNDEMVVDRFYVANNAAGEPSLFCDAVRPSNTAVTTTTELITGVESFQVLLGEDTNADRTADRYLGVGVGVPVPNVDNVVSVKVSLLLRSDDRVIEGRESRKFNHFGAGYAPGDVPPVADAGAVFNSAGAALDSRMRRLYHSNVALRNRLN